MGLLDEYAITPEVFIQDSYASVELGRERLLNLKDLLIQEAVTRDFRGGDWYNQAFSGQNTLHPNGKELLKKIKQQGRIRSTPPLTSNVPVSDVEWGEDAVGSHTQDPLNGVIVSDDSLPSFQGNTIVGCLGTIRSCNWWQNRSNSIRIHKQIIDYKGALQTILETANHIMFIDPHINPTQDRYKNLLDLIVIAGVKRPRTKIEIHRRSYIGSGPSRTPVAPGDWELSFSREWANSAQQHDFEIEVFIWEDFHDRYLISNLCGIDIPYGFDVETSRDPAKLNQLTTWTRIGRDTRDSVMKEFENNVGPHRLVHQFTIK
jgi:hypothetical protein